jgi:hypothetical protein
MRRSGRPRPRPCLGGAALAAFGQLRRLPAVAGPPVPLGNREPPGRVHQLQFAQVFIKASSAWQRAADHAHQVMGLEGDAVLAVLMSCPPEGEMPV